jgi:hypothetical protein
MIENINVGSQANDGTGDKLRNAFIIVNENFDYIQSILDTCLIQGSVEISDINGLQTILDTLSEQVDYIPGLQEQISNLSGSISYLNSAISTINDNILTIDTEITDINVILTDIQSQITDIQTELTTKIDEAPIDGTTYGRKDGDWFEISPEAQDLQSVTDLGSTTTNGIYSDIGFFTDSRIIDSQESLGYFARQSDYIGIYISDPVTAFGSNQFFVNTEDGLYYTKANPDNSQSNEFYVNEFNTFSKNGYKSLWGEFGDNGELDAAGYYDGLTRRFYFFSGAANYGYANQMSSIYTTAEEGIALKAEGLDSIFIYSSDINVTVDEISLRKSSYNTEDFSTTIDNQLRILNNETLSMKSYGTEEGFNGSFVLFNTGADEFSATGKLKWNDVDGTLDLGLKGDNVVLQIGQESVIRVVNKTATNITLQGSNYQAVRITGAQGQRLKVDLALATTDALSAETIGLVTETIANNQEGFITTSGLVNNINTTGSLQGETWNDGDILYLSPTVAGRITNIKPSAPSHMVIIGYVVYAHSQNGKIFVKVNNGYELDELHNVNISGTPSNNSLLAYNSSNDLWENKSINNVFGYNPYRFISTTQSVGSNAAGETMLIRVTIPANSFSSSDKFYFRLGFSKVGAVNANTIRVKLTTSSTMPTGATSQITQAAMGNTALYAPVERTMAISGGNLKGYPFTNSNVSDSATNTNAWSSVAFDVTQTQYFYVSVTPASTTTDVTYLEYIEIKNN